MECSCTKELSDIVCLHGMVLTLSVYLFVHAPNKIVTCFTETSQLEEIVLDSKKVGFQPDYATLLQYTMHTNPEKGAEFASTWTMRVVHSFTHRHWTFCRHLCVPEHDSATSFLLDALKDNKPEQAHLQTRLLEMNLIHAPQVADVILGNKMFTHYDCHGLWACVRSIGTLQWSQQHQAGGHAFQFLNPEVRYYNFSQLCWEPHTFYSGLWSISSNWLLNSRLLAWMKCFKSTFVKISRLSSKLRLNTQIFWALSN